MLSTQLFTGTIYEYRPNLHEYTTFSVVCSIIMIRVKSCEDLLITSYYIYSSAFALAIFNFDSNGIYFEFYSDKRTYLALYRLALLTSLKCIRIDADF